MSAPATAASAAMGAAAPAPDGTAQGTSDDVTPGFAAWYAVILLTAIYLVSFMDRQIMSLLVEPIKKDLQLSDAQIGGIQGLAFGLLFTLSSIPMGWLADRISRRKLIAGAVVVWSGLTAACGAANTLLQLTAARVGVGIGESALGPCAAPMIRELFPKRAAVTALSVYMMGIPLGGGVALLMGSIVYPWVQSLGVLSLPLIGEVKPWQTTFMIISLPGFLLALLILTIKEPARPPRGAAGGAAPIGPALAYMAQNWKAFVGLGLPGIGAMALTFGVGFWIPAALGRTFHIAPPDIPQYMKTWGLMTMVLGSTGTLMGGVLADWIRRKREDGYILYAIIGIAVMASSYALFALTPSPAIALAVLAPAALVMAVPPVAATSAAMEIIPRSMRSLVFAIWMALTSLIGMSIGPPAIGMLSDALGVATAIPLFAAACAAFSIPILLAARKPFLATVANANRLNAGA